jgi:adenosylcobinamide kinase/adenosylcobinamide-phosphate guanylyltransferase
MWLTNLLALNDKDHFQHESDQLKNILSSLPGDIIFVSNEVGMGIIPMGELTRDYVDEAGRLHQQLAQQVDHVILMVAGLPLCIKGNLA